MRFPSLLALIAIAAIQPAHGLAVDLLESPERLIDSEQLCSGEGGHIEIPAEWARVVRDVRFNCRPETEVDAVGQGREPRVFLRYSLQNASFHGYRLVELRVFLAGDSGSREYVLDRPFAAIKQWLRRHFGQVAVPSRKRLSEGQQVKVLPDGLYLRTDEISSVRAFADPENRARTVISFQWAD
jgi:hypothetical protein